MSKGRTTIYEDDELRVEGELVKGHPFLHCYVNDFKKSTARKIKRVWEDIKEGFYLEGYENIYSLSDNKRFIKFIGGTMVEENEEGGLYTWELQQY